MGSSINATVRSVPKSASLVVKRLKAMYAPLTYEDLVMIFTSAFLANRTSFAKGISQAYILIT